MTPSPAAVDVQVATDEDLREAIDDVPQAAGVSLEELREQAEASRSHRRTPNHLVHVSELVDRLPALRRSPASSPTTSQRFSIGVTDGTRLSTVLREPELCIAAPSQ